MRSLSALLLTLLGCAQAPPTKEFRPAADVEVLAAPDSVQAFRLTDGPISPGGRGRIEWHQWPVESSATVDAGTARELAALLADPRSFALEPIRGAIPRPGVKFIFRRGSATLGAMLCFQSRMITFYGGGQSANFDPSVRELARLVKRLFPKDPGIQALP